MNFRYHHGDRPLDGYTILRGIGRGGFGEVYYAVSDGGREVALKVIQQNHDIELRGVRHCINLKTPHLISIFDVKTNAEGIPFVVMEYVAGSSLRDLISGAPAGMAPDKAVFLAREIGKGLSYLHDRGIVHRDLKPENIFYEDGYVKIGDYGLSKYISVSRQSGQTISVGTVHYMAPEIGSGNYHHGIDIYALGIILFELLTGNVPFNGDSMGEILMKHLSMEPDVSPLPPLFQPIVRKALAKKPAERYGSVKEMVDEIFRNPEIAEQVSKISASSFGGQAIRPVGAVETPRPAEKAAAAAPRGWPPSPAREEPAPPKEAFQGAQEPVARSMARSTRKELEHRLVSSVLTAAGMAWGIGLLPASKGSVEDFFAHLLLIATGVATVFLADGWVIPYFGIATGGLRRLATLGTGGPLFGTMLAILSQGCGIRHLGGNIFYAFLLSMFLVDWGTRVKRDRTEKISLFLAFTAAVLGLFAGGISDSDPFLVAGVLAAISLVSSAAAAWDGKRGRRSRREGFFQTKWHGEEPPAPPSPAAVLPGSPTILLPSRENEPPAAPRAPTAMVRPREGRVIAGVCAGIARRYDWEVVWVRLLFPLTIFLGGTGVFVYLLLWLLMPAAPKKAKPTVSLPAASCRGGGARFLWFLLSAGLFIGGARLLSTFPLSARRQVEVLPLSVPPVVLVFSLAGFSLLMALARNKGSALVLDSRGSIQRQPHRGWAKLGRLLVALSIVEALFVVFVHLCPADFFRGQPFLQGLSRLARKESRFPLSLLFFIPGVVCLVFARRSGGPAHVLRGVIGWTAASVLLLFLATLLPQWVQVRSPWELEWMGPIGPKEGGMLLFLGALSLGCLWWPRWVAASERELVRS